MAPTTVGGRPVDGSVRRANPEPARADLESSASVHRGLSVRRAERTEADDQQHEPDDTPERYGVAAVGGRQPRHGVILPRKASAGYRERHGRHRRRRPSSVNGHGTFAGTLKPLRDRGAAHVAVASCSIADPGRRRQRAAARRRPRVCGPAGGRRHRRRTPRPRSGRLRDVRRRLRRRCAVRRRERRWRLGRDRDWRLGFGRLDRDRRLRSRGLDRDRRLGIRRLRRRGLDRDRRLRIRDFGREPIADSGMGRCMRRHAAGGGHNRHHRAQQEKSNEHPTPSRHGTRSLDATNHRRVPVRPPHFGASIGY
jgi:hypothetical protein